MKNVLCARPSVALGSLFRCTFLLCISLMVSAAFAWGTQGHQVIAGLAEAQLTPRARAEVDRLLSLEPGETIQTISTWADEHRSSGTGPWHYVNFPRGTCNYDAQRDCPSGRCVVGIVDRELQTLGSTAPDKVRLIALKNVVHFVADLHQPLHAGYLDDKGGNKFQLQAFVRASNLHALWDSGLIKNLSEDSTALTSRLRASPIPDAVADLNVVTAAQESCKIVAMPGFYPDRKVNADYIERFTPVLEQRLIAAGARLAGLLNRVFQ